MHSSWKPTNNSCVLLILGVMGWWVRRDAVGGEEAQGPERLAPVPGRSGLLLAPLSLPVGTGQGNLLGLKKLPGTP